VKLLYEEKQTMIEEYDFHRKEYNKWIGWVMMAGLFCGLIFLVPIGIPLFIVAIIKISKHGKAFEVLQKECFLKSLNGIDKDKYAKMYQYMMSRKTFFG